MHVEAALTAHVLGCWAADHPPPHPQRMFCGKPRIAGPFGGNFGWIHFLPGKSRLLSDR